MRRVWFAALAMSGCTEAGEITLDLTANPIAVGANVVGVLENRTCDSDGIRCDLIPVEIDSFTVTPAGVFELMPTPTSHFTLRALEAGSASLKIDVASEGTSKSFTRGLVAVEPNAVVLTPPCPSPLTYTIAATAQIGFELRHDTTALHGSDFYPFDVTGIAIDTATSKSDVLGLRMPADPGSGQLTSSLDPTATLGFNVIAPTSIDGIMFGEPVDASVFGYMKVPLTVFAAGQRVCGDQLTRTFTTLTPDICTFDRNANAATITFSEVGSQELLVLGRGPGTCMVSVALGGTSLTATTTLTFTM